VDYLLQLPTLAYRIEVHAHAAKQMPEALNIAMQPAAHVNDVHTSIKVSNQHLVAAEGGWASLPVLLSNASCGTV
jgi:hypothetical protein